MVDTCVYVILCCVVFPELSGVLRSSNVCAFYAFEMVGCSTPSNANVNESESYNFTCMVINDVYKEWIAIYVEQFTFCKSNQLL